MSLMSKQEIAGALFSGDAVAMDPYEADQLGPERWVYEFEDGTQVQVYMQRLDEDGWVIPEDRPTPPNQEDGDA